MHPPSPTDLDALSELLEDQYDLVPAVDLAELFAAPGAPTLRYRPPNRPELGKEDFRNLTAFARRLQRRADSLSAHLADQLPPAPRQQLAEWLPTEPLSLDLEKILLDTLNTLLAGPSLYTPERFSTPSALRRRTRRDIEAKTSGPDRQRLNRLLLEDAFPSEIDRGPRRFRVRTPDKPLAIRVADRLDLHPDALIFDGLLGTIALIHFLPPADTPDLRSDVRRHIANGAYLRHLLLENLRPGDAHQHPAPLAIELVFIREPPAAPNPPSPPDELPPPTDPLDDELQACIRRGHLLHAVGTNVVTLRRNPAEDGTSDPLLRGFSWLLHKTRAWLDRSTATAAPTSDAPSAAPESGSPATTPFIGPPVELMLRDFRLAGDRTCKLDSTSLLLAVHGANGSGKSSFVEALELLAVGSVERLGSRDHAEVLTNDLAFKSTPRRVAQVEIRNARGDTRSTRVAAGGIEIPPLSPLPAPSFRHSLDATLRLSREDPAAISNFFYGAYFREAAPLLAQTSAALSRLKALLAALPERIAKGFLSPSGQPSLAQIESGSVWLNQTPIPWEQVRALSSLATLDDTSLADLQALLPPDFREAFSRTAPVSWDDATAASARIDAALGDLADRLPTLERDLAAAIEFLTAYGSSVASGPVPRESGDLATHVRHWLEFTALVDLLETEDRLRATIEAAHVADPHAFPHEPKPLLVVQPPPPAFDPAKHREGLAHLRSRRDEARSSILAFTPALHPTEAAANKLPELHRFNLHALDALAQASVFGPDFKFCQPSLSQAVRDAFGPHRQVVTVAQKDLVLIRIGESGWAQTLLLPVQRSVNALSRLRSLAPGIVAPPTARERLTGLLSCLRDLRSASIQLADLNRQGAEALVQQLRGLLGEALNELTASFTPARWAYSDVVVEIAHGSDLASASEPPRVEFTQASVPVQFRYNSAQFSTLTLCLFLLCNRAREHPLRLGLLDDPLENMDELTVTTVARGLARYLRLRAALGDTPDRWRLVLFLHGEQDVERIRQEVPCPAHFLPWLSPQRSRTAKPGEIRQEPSWLDDRLQDVHALIQPL